MTGNGHKRSDKRGNGKLPDKAERKMVMTEKVLSTVRRELESGTGNTNGGAGK